MRETTHYGGCKGPPEYTPSPLRAQSRLPGGIGGALSLRPALGAASLDYHRALAALAGDKAVLEIAR